MAPPIVFPVLLIAFGITVVGATVMTERNANLTRWPSADGYSPPEIGTNRPSEENDTRSQIDVRGRALVASRTGYRNVGA